MPPQRHIKLLIADDHELTRFSLQMIFTGQNNIHLVGLAENGQEAVDLVKRHYPDIILLDLQMPVLDGLSAASEIKKIAPQTRIVIYTSVKDPQAEVMSQGVPVDKFCPKDVATEELVDLVNELGQQSLSH